MLICGGGALLGSKCMEIKVSYVQARRFIDFHTLILNSYNKYNQKAEREDSNYEKYKSNK